ncbi:MAG TPA: GrpB family protein, partial [Candidatus Baltobacteraceae bacterium]|nr:GrpB family protein [Candidatus Baltobacteraceae bacterium]
IGCGTGELTTILRERGHFVVAVDPKAPEALDALRVQFESFDAPDHYFDAVVMQLVLHHAHDMDTLLDKVVRTMRPDGLIAIDDYGWERPGDVPDGWREERSDLHTSSAMLLALRRRFVQQLYVHRAHFNDGDGDDRLGFWFIGTPAGGWPLFVGGREKRKVVLAEHNPEWRMRFEVERRRIVGALGGKVRRIEHIGSTSVPGLAAKPIVDILVAVDDPLDDETRDALGRAGYTLRVEEPEHRMYRTAAADVHVHLWPAGSPEIERHLAFRDRLRSHAPDRETYERVKRELARRDWNDVNDYANAKTVVVSQILASAGA